MDRIEAYWLLDTVVRVNMNGEIPDFSSHRQAQTDSERKSAWVRLTAEYLHDLPRQLDEIRVSLVARDYPAIKQYAHRAKGTSGTYHLDSIAKMFADLEQLTEKRNSDEIAATLSRIGSLVELETEKFSRSTASLSDRSERNTSG